VGEIDWNAIEAKIKE